MQNHNLNQISATSPFLEIPKIGLVNEKVVKGRLEVRWPLKGNFVYILVSLLAKLPAKKFGLVYPVFYACARKFSERTIQERHGKY